MRYKRLLTKDQIQYLINNANESNKQLAEKLKVSPGVIAIYKWRARQAGIELPKYCKNLTIIEEIKTMKK